MTVPQDSLGRFPTHAGVGNGNAVTQFRHSFGNRLIALFQITLDHQPDERWVSPGALLNHIAPDFFLPGLLLGGVGVAAIHHQH